MVFPMNEPSLCVLRWEDASLLHKAAQPGLCPPSLSWQPSVAVDFIHITPHLCTPAREQKLLHSPLGIHPLKHAPLFHSPILGSHGNILIKGRYMRFCCFPIAVFRCYCSFCNWQDLDQLTISQLSTFLLMK